MKTMGMILAMLALAAGSACGANQTDEAAVVFDGKKASEMRGGTWKVVYSSAEGPQGRALEVLTDSLGRVLLREPFRTTPLVLPLERAGGVPVKSKRDVICVGIPGENAMLDKMSKAGRCPKAGT